MSYTVLARRYRSTTFDEIVGQEAIARTLKNAIERGRTAHAYLFTGTRGVGKTSMARIFAKTINISDALTQKDEVAKSILRGEDIDVIEIDAASNTGVDNVRDLIANASLSPARSPYKIYIIDEVHMLSKNAFNALLKIMEEPPAHVKFILCTTEVQKIPATILSRCQRFDFRNIPAPKIAEHLREVLKNEKIKADDEVIGEVARLANGSMRDGLSLLDRLIAAGEGKLSIDLLIETLGVPDHTLVANVVDAMLSGDAKASLEAASALLNRGVSIEHALEVLAEHLRNVMVISACGPDSDLVELFGAAKEAAARHAEQTDPAGVVHMIALIESCASHIKRSSTQRALFDALIVRLAMTEHLASIPALLSGRSAATGGGGVIVEKKKSLAPPSAPPQRAAPAVETPSPSSAPAPSLPGARRIGTGRTTRDDDDEQRDDARSHGRGGEPSESDREAALRSPLVRQTMELFEAAIVRVTADTPDEAEDDTQQKHRPNDDEDDTTASDRAEKED